MTPTKILVVDDEPDLELLIRQRFRRQVRDGRFDFVFAHNGVEALAQLGDHPDVDLVLSDINMPEMDGLTLLGRIQQGAANLKAVMVSAYGDLRNIRAAMNRGAFDFVTKPIDFEDLELTINKTIEELSKIRDGLEARQELVALRGELEVARQIQQSILPRDFGPKGAAQAYSVSAEMIPAKEVGGDFYDFFMIDDHRLGVVLGDVAGKGVPAAIYMSLSRTLIRSTALRGIQPGECLKIANQTLCTEGDSGLFVTVCYAIVDTRTGAVDYSTGGHFAPYFVHGDGRVDAPPLTGGLALGVDGDVDYATKQTQMAPDDLMVLYSDGVTEAMDAQDALFTEQRFEATLATAAGRGEADAIVATISALQEFAAGHPQADDITMVAVKRLS
ncbi:MAG TPA: SpoIIE family protein phosphatase [Vicinamibacterales bacterium]|jgi:sigma-B regulation protein RsbU (phosphoserine phosphatase)